MTNQLSAVPDHQPLFFNGSVVAGCCQYHASRPALDPDPLTVLGQEATWVAGWEDGYEKGVRDSFPPRVATLLVAVTMLVVGLLIGWSIGGGA